ncbi:MAG: hypothetical protein CMP21_08310 [Rickettsiales bacterium]|nr:hypothetical protein [Rickettsiales bacterium]|tara:strand:- start:881 stop:1453 length:573 start_codon:yes stop_codon:yes gene_type:complete
MKPSDLLSDELDQILCMLDILEVMHERLSQGKPVNLDDLKRIIQYFKIFANRTHNKKEEKILFPALRRHSGVQSNDIINQLKSENSLAELYLTSLKHIIKDVKKGSFQAKEKMLTLLKKYLVLEKTHLHNEQIFVIPLCNQEIPEDKQEKILKEFQAYDEKLFGHGMQRKFHKAFGKVIKNLQKHYYTDN